MRLRLPGSGRGPDDTTAGTAPPAPAQALPAEWSVPLGVRTASEWAWRSLVLAAAVGGVLYLTSILSEIVIPILVTLLLAALLQPLFGLLARIMPRGLAALVTVVGTLAVIVGLLSFVASQLTSQLDDITTKVTQGIEQIRAWSLDTFGLTNSELDAYIAKARDLLSQGNLGDTAAAAGLTVGHLLAGFFLSLFTLFFFLYDGATIWGWVVRLFPRGAREKAHSSGIIAWGQLAAFTRATLLVAAVDAIGIGVGAAILGVPFASGIGLLVFFGAFIPIVGAGISGSVAVLLALVALGPVKALVMLAIVIGVQQLESHILQPLLIGRAMRLHPLAVLLAIAAGIILAGIIGGLIAVPTIAVLNAVGHHLLDGPPTAPGEPGGKGHAEEVLGSEAAARAEAEAEAYEARARAEHDAEKQGTDDTDG